MKNKRFVSDNSFRGSNQNADQQNNQELELLDAYSRAVIGVVDKVSPAVISLTGKDSRGAGSGFLVSSNGYVITNHHVAEDRTDLIAKTTDGDAVDATLLGSDPANDIAVVKLHASDLPTIEIGDSSQLKVGQLMVAIGSPLGLQSTVSTGIVSALGRSMRAQDGRLMEQVIQHSAPINPGNSGGPLVDSLGRVVGVNTAIIAMTQGLGFAVASNTAKWVLEQILANGEVKRRQLGIAAANIQIGRELMIRYDLLSDRAVQVAQVERGADAESAGIHPGDIIVAINDRIVTGIDDIHRLLTTIPITTPLTLSLIRNQELIERTILTKSWSVKEC